MRLFVVAVTHHESLLVNQLYNIASIFVYKKALEKSASHKKMSDDCIRVIIIILWWEQVNLEEALESL